MSVRRNSDGSQPPEPPFISTRALVIVCVAVAAAVAVAKEPGLAVPIGVGLAVVTLLATLVG